MSPAVGFEITKVSVASKRNGICGHRSQTKKDVLTIRYSNRHIRSGNFNLIGR